MVDRIQEKNDAWDVIIIGGGATGIGAAIEAASRGYKTLLLEQYDFGKGTSSRSTKMIHGGVRYLQQGNIKLVLEALRERGHLLNNAPHIVHSCSFVVPNYHWWEAPFYGTGLGLYDLLSGSLSLGRSRLIRREKVLELAPTIEPENLRGGVMYFDGQFDDTRLLINMAQTAAEHGAVLLNYMKVNRLVHANSKVNGVIAKDLESEEELELKAKVIINATGVFADEIRLMDNASARRMISPSQGVHIVLDHSFLPGNTAIMVPKTDDGRVLFAIPWQNYAVVGTTDTPVESIPIEPKPLEQEIDFLLGHSSRYLAKDPAKEDILSTFAGLRPLVSLSREQNTKSISREHTIEISASGLVTVTGGKWTTYRKMAEDTIKKAASLGGLPAKPSITKTLKLHGYHTNSGEFGKLGIYGADAPLLRNVAKEKPEWNDFLHPDLQIQAVEVIWSVRHEMARTVEDFLARRRRVLFQDARKSIEIAPKVAALMAEEMGYDNVWRDEQVKTYTKLAEQYLMK